MLTKQLTSPEKAKFIRRSIFFALLINSQTREEIDRYVQSLAYTHSRVRKQEIGFELNLLVHKKVIERIGNKFDIA